MLEYETNADEVMVSIKKRYIGLTEPIAPRVYNTAPQARWIEYGGMKLYQRASRENEKGAGKFHAPKGVKKPTSKDQAFVYFVRVNPQPKSKWGTHALPKGGKSIRDKWKTLLIQYPYAMVRNSKPNIKARGKKLLQEVKINGRGGYVRAANQIALYARQQFIFRTPVGKGQEMIKLWKIESAK